MLELFDAAAQIAFGQIRLRNSVRKKAAAFCRDAKAKLANADQFRQINAVQFSRANLTLLVT